MVPGTLITACAGDQDVFASTTSPAEATSTTLAATTSSLVPTTTQDSGTTIPEAAELSIEFTYDVTSSQGPAHNPYVAVWIEDETGDLVTTLGLWLLQTQKGLRWVNELRRWDSVDGTTQTIETISSATRTPGDYRLLWDMSYLDGSPVEGGDYYVCIEAAREHGPYSLIRERLSLGADAFEMALDDQGELADATVSYIV